MGLNFSDRVLKNPDMSNLLKIHPVESELFHADRHDEAKNHFSQFCKCA